MYIKCLLYICNSRYNIITYGGVSPKFSTSWNCFHSGANCSFCTKVVGIFIYINNTIEFIISQYLTSFCYFLAYAVFYTSNQNYPNTYVVSFLGVCAKKNEQSIKQHERFVEHFHY